MKIWLCKKKSASELTSEKMNGIQFSIQNLKCRHGQSSTILNIWRSPGWRYWAIWLYINSILDAQRHKFRNESVKINFCILYEKKNRILSYVSSQLLLWIPDFNQKGLWSRPLVLFSTCIWNGAVKIHFCEYYNTFLKIEFLTVKYIQDMQRRKQL